MRLEFTIPGRPQQQGSKRHVGRGVMIESNKNLRPWRDAAICHAQDARRDAGLTGHGALFTRPVVVSTRFYFARPKSHYGTGRNADVLKDNAPIFYSSAPDLDKLQRALGDALEEAGIVRNDALIVLWHDPVKVYAEVPQTWVAVEPAETWPPADPPTRPAQHQEAIPF